MSAASRSAREIQIACDGLARIANNPDETEERRARAKKALEHVGDDLPNTYGPQPWEVVNRALPRGHSGGDSLNADAIYDGWDTK